MFTGMTKRGPGTNLDKIREFEGLVRSPLPNSYQEFLLKFNGGIPIEYAIQFQGAKLRISGSSICRFYYLSDDITYGLAHVLDDLRNRLPEGIIGIGESPSGNFFILSLREDSYGQIFYKDHEFEDKSPFDPKSNSLPESIVKVADSFEDFLSRLYDPDA